IPQKPQIFGHEQPIDEEKVARLLCRSSGSKPAAQLRWRKGNRELKGGGGIWSTRCRIWGSRSGIWGARYRIWGSRSGIWGARLSPHCSSPPFPDKPTAKIEPHPQYPREGEKLQLQCDGQGNPISIPKLNFPGKSRGVTPVPCVSPQEFLWEKEGSDAPLQLSSDSVLIFPFLNKSDSGTYVCTATSSMGSVVAKYNLDVSVASQALCPLCPLPQPAQNEPPEAQPCAVTPCVSFSLFSPPAWADASPVPSTSSTYHAMIGGVVAVIVFLLLSLLIVLGHYLIRHKGTYLTHEAKGSDDAPDADTAIINAEGGQAGGDDKKEYFI
ncbi:CADM3 protein, partial [Leucopsar rothschildi]|nr:CADM3 protein [Leucopsar rothschildi]